MGVAAPCCAASGCGGGYVIVCAVRFGSVVVHVECVWVWVWHYPPEVGSLVTKSPWPFRYHLETANLSEPVVCLKKFNPPRTNRIVQLIIVPITTSTKPCFLDLI
jgi:hypothetical protein